MESFLDDGDGSGSAGKASPFGLEHSQSQVENLGREVIG